MFMQKRRLGAIYDRDTLGAFHLVFDIRAFHSINETITEATVKHVHIDWYKFAYYRTGRTSGGGDRAQGAAKRHGRMLVQHCVASCVILRRCCTNVDGAWLVGEG
jgi:hypothetical protein